MQLSVESTVSTFPGEGTQAQGCKVTCLRAPRWWQSQAQNRRGVLPPVQGLQTSPHVRRGSY